MSYSIFESHFMINQLKDESYILTNRGKSRLFLCTNVRVLEYEWCNDVQDIAYKEGSVEDSTFFFFLYNDEYFSSFSLYKRIFLNEIYDHFPGEKRRFVQESPK